MNREGLGASALQTEPKIEQWFISLSTKWTLEDIEDQLYLLRKQIECKVQEQMGLSNDELFFASLSGRTIVYKGQLTPEQVCAFYWRRTISVSKCIKGGRAVRAAWHKESSRPS